MDKIPMTAAGAARLETELKDLKHVQRPAIIVAIQDARALGDLSENAEYHSAKERQGYIEGRISYLEGVLGSTEIIDPAKMKCDEVKFSATVKIADAENGEEKSYRIVGDEEADVAGGCISIGSPIARALIGRHVGDTAEFQSPRGPREFEVLEIRYE
ncbi:MAG: transcription elongation factor GreA [Rickettsiales bacterium]|nr:transcription elongation factor GreA [Rickettsiales bacterium]